MQSKVRLSKYALILTLIITGALSVGCLVTIKETPAFYFVAGILLLLLFFGFLYGPKSIKADSDYITVKTLLKRIKIPMRDVESVKLLQPTMGAIRICASGGFMGYWGLFREGDIGRYCAYYGKASDCFLVKLKTGDKYMLGCENPDAMVNYIKSL